LNSVVTRVTVFPDRAVVTRVGKELLSAGSRELTLAELPALLVPESVRARVRSTAPVVLVSTDVRQVFHEDPLEERAAELRAELDRLEADEVRLQRALDAIGTRGAVVARLAESAGPELARGLARGRLGIEAGAELDRFLAAQLSTLADEQQQVEADRRELDKRLRAARERLEQVSRPRSRQSFSVIAVVELPTEAEQPAAAEVEVEVSYQVTGAAWTPLYDLRFAEGDVDLRLSYLGQVTQNTGEDWEDIELTLSTVRPALASAIPELKPWYLRPYYPPPAAAMEFSVPAMLMAESAPRARAQASAAPPPPTMREAVERSSVVQENAGSVVFVISGGTRIPSDGAPHRVLVGKHEFGARFDLVSAPKLGAHCHRRARVQNDSPFLLLAGQGQLFHQGEFLGSVPLKAVAPNEQFEAFLGVEERVRITRKMVEGSVDKRFLSDQRRLTFAYEIRATNLTAQRQSLTLLDQVPVAGDERIKTRRLETRPQPHEETELGRLRWELTLEPRGEQTVRFGFQVEHPRDLPVAELPPLADG
jgi:uncharacterized protein (TIGR02231 family)